MGGSTGGSAGSTGERVDGGGAVEDGMGRDAALDGAGDTAPPASVCGDPIDIVEGCVLRDGLPVTSSMTQNVRTISIEDVAPGACSALRVPGGAGTGMTKHLVVQAADQTKWDVFVRMPNLPTDILLIDEELGLELEALEQTWIYTTVDQTFALKRSGTVILFASVVQGSPLPSLGSFDIQVSDAGVECETPIGAFGCGLRGHALQATIAGASAKVSRGQTLQLGDVSLTLERFEQPTSAGQCDTKAVVQMAGFWRP